MGKYLLAGLGALLVALGALLWLQSGRLDAANEKLATAQEARRNAEASLTKAREQAKALATASLSRQQELNRLRLVAEAQQKALDEALQANPDWARTPIPDSVRRAITEPIAPSGPAGPRVDGARPGASALGKR